MKAIKPVLLFALLLSPLFFFSQKIGVVDTDYILSKFPQYKEAQARLDAQVAQWQSEVETLQKEYDEKKAALDNERVLLVGDQLKQREKEVNDLEKNLKQTIQNRFGAKGEIINSRSSLTKPFQDQIWNAIKTVVEKNNLGIVIDKTGSAGVLFLDKKYDYTDKVLDLLLKNQPSKGESNRENSTKSDAAAQKKALNKGKLK